MTKNNAAKVDPLQSPIQPVADAKAAKLQELSGFEVGCPSSDKYGILASDIEEALAHLLFHFMLQGFDDASVVF